MKKEYSMIYLLVGPYERMIFFVKDLSPLIIAKLRNTHINFHFRINFNTLEEAESYVKITEKIPINVTALILEDSKSLIQSLKENIFYAQDSLLAKFIKRCEKALNMEEENE